MSPCESYQELISRMVDGELSAREQDELKRHLEVCADCAALYSAFSALSEQIGSDLEEAPKDLKENVMAEIRREAIRKRNRLPNVLRGVLSAAACVAVIVGVYLGVSMARSNQMSAAVYDKSVRETSVAAEEEAPMLADASEEESVTTDAALPENVREEPDAAAPSETENRVETKPASAEGAAETQADAEAVDDEPQEAAPEAPTRELLHWDLSLLRELLKGEPTELTPESLEPALRELVLVLGDGEVVTVRLYERDGVLYYLDPVEETVYQAALTPAEWDAFFAEPDA